MIRRETTAADGSPTWLLISQLEHARLAAEFAAAWDDARRPLIEPRESFIAIVRKHDDGWSVWEQRPEVCRGKPRDFMEMPLDESLGIWRRSIAAAQVIDPIAGLIVGGHFRRLCALGFDKHTSAHDWPAEVEHLAVDFLEEQDGLRADWLATFDPADRPAADDRARRGVQLLQWFDYVSLWLCCAERIAPQTIVGPDDESFVFTPERPDRIRIAPWPLKGESWQFSAVGREIPRGTFATADALAAAPSVERRLTWELVAGRV